MNKARRKLYRQIIGYLKLEDSKLMISPVLLLHKRKKIYEA